MLYRGVVQNCDSDSIDGKMIIVMLMLRMRTLWDPQFDKNHVAGSRQINIIIIIIIINIRYNTLSVILDTICAPNS
jgi:hypothetical protein